MRAWGQRPDTLVEDEPLCSYYLARAGRNLNGTSGVAEPSKSWVQVLDDVIGGVPAGVRVHYQKHMAHHLPVDANLSFVRQLRNFILIRHPASVVRSYSKLQEDVRLDDLGYADLDRLASHLDARSIPFLVIDADELVTYPEFYLRKLCDYAGVPFDSRMLSWSAGRSKSDGMWGDHWYKSLWASTEFVPPASSGTEVNGDHRRLVDRCLPTYERLRSRRLHFAKEEL